jgi:integrase
MVKQGRSLKKSDEHTAKIEQDRALKSRGDREALEWQLDGGKWRNEPYWSRVEKDLHLGYRRTESGNESWIARYRGSDKKRLFLKLGEVKAAKSGEPGSYDHAVSLARAFKAKCDKGLKKSDVKTVADACRLYVEDRQDNVRDDGRNAADAEGRFTRTVYGRPFGEIQLSKLCSADITKWRNGLKSKKGAALSGASTNRYLTALKAALYLAVKRKHVDADRVSEWRDVAPEDGGESRDEYLTPDERRAMLAQVEGHARTFMHALCLLPIRPQAMGDLTVSSFDKRTSMLTVGKDKGHDPRKMKVGGEALALILSQIESRPKSAPLFPFNDDDGFWNKERWKQPVKRAAIAAKFEADRCKKICAYTFRHSVITDLVTNTKLSLAYIASDAGTSILMIEKHYAQMRHDDAAEARNVLALNVPAYGGQG